MKRSIVSKLAGISLSALCAMPLAAFAQSGPLKVVAVDVEGGGGTLFVTPEGKSVLIDAGWPAGMGNPAGATSGPSSAERFVGVAKALGLKQIDYLIVSHYHADHVGGLAELLKLFPVVTVVDHGGNLEPLRPGATPRPSDAAPLFDIYEAAMRGRKRMTVKAGDRLQVGSLRIDVTNAAGQVVDNALVPGAKPVACTRQMPDTSVSNENDASIGIVATFGRARILSLADTTQKVEKRLVCPANKIGAIDLLIVSHHGSALSSSSELLEAANARVAIVGNGATKGGDREVLERLKATPSRPPLWQLHGATRSPEFDVDAVRIANPAGVADGMYSITATVSPNGQIVVENARNRLSTAYPPAR